MAKDKHGLTPKQKLLADAYIETGNGTQAALQAYDTTDPNVAAVIGYENLRKPQIMAYISARCKEANLTIDRVLGKLSDQLDAEHTLQTATGEVLGKEPDWGMRHKAIETSLKYALPEFIALRQGDGGQPDAGSRHLHLHSVPDKVLKMVAKRAIQAEDEEPG
jgi:hypothetical protein